MLPFRLKFNQLNIISLAGIRGAAAIAFAIMAVNSPAVLSVDVYHIVFGICVLSSLIQGSLMPFAAKRLDMLDPGYGFKDFQLLSGQIGNWLFGNKNRSEQQLDW